MTAKTRFGFEGYGVRRAGSFAGRAATQTLTPSLFTNSNSFYAATVTAGAVTLHPGLFTDADSFFGPTVSRGAVSLTPSLFTDGDAFFSATVKATYSLAPDLYTDADTFYGPTVSRGSVTLLPALYSDPDTFFSPIVTGGAAVLRPPLLVNENGFFPAIVTTQRNVVIGGLFAPPPRRRREPQKPVEISCDGLSGQVVQDVTADLRISIEGRGAAKQAANFANAGTEIGLHFVCSQRQSEGAARLYGKLSMAGSFRSIQSDASPAVQLGVIAGMVGKSGGEAPIVPEYHGEPEFFRPMDEAA